MREKILIKKIKRGDFTPQFLSKWFILFFRDEPWNQYLKCIHCDPGYTSKAAFSFKKAKEGLKFCPFCGKKLELFWSPQRSYRFFLEAYKKKGFLGFKATNELNQIVGWIWGHEIKLKNTSQKTFYVDMLGVIPRYRSYRPLIVADLYLNLLDELEKRKFSFILVSAPLQAKNVKSLHALAGFKEAKEFGKDFSIKSLKLVDWGIEYLRISSVEEFNQNYKKAFKILKVLVEKLNKAKKSYNLSILIKNDALSVEKILSRLKKMKASPDFIMLASKLTIYQKIFFDTLENKNLAIVKTGEDFFPTLLSIWYLMRLGRAPAELSLFFKANPKKIFGAKKIITILPEKYRSQEKKVKEILKNSIWKREIKKINYIYY